MSQTIIVAAFCSSVFFILGLMFGAMLGGPKPPFKGGV